MAAPQDDSFDDDLDADDPLEEHYQALRGFVLDYIEEHDVSDEEVAALLLDIAIELRKICYVLDTEKPSVSGLKLVLDRYGSDVESVVREHKKEAETFLDGMREAMTAAGESLARAADGPDAGDASDDDEDAADEARDKAGGTDPAGRVNDVGTPKKRG